MIGLDLGQAIPGIENYAQKPGATVSTMLTAGGILLLSAIIVLIVVIIKRWHGRVVPILFGVLAYAIFGFIFTNLVMSALILIPTFDQAFTNNQATYAVIYCIISAIGITVARLIMGNILKERYDRQGDVMISGVGLGIGDAFLFGSSILMYSIYATAINNNGLDVILSEMNEDEAVTVFTQYIEPLYSTNPTIWLIYGLSAVMDVVLCILLMKVIYGAVTKQIPGVWIFISGVAQAIISVPMQIANMSNLTNVLILFLVKLMMFVGSFWYVDKILTTQITYSED